MTPPPPSFTVAPPAVPAAPRGRSLGCIIALTFLGLFVAGSVAVTVAAFQAFRLGPEAQDLRAATRAHFETQGSWHPQVELRMGPWTCALFREIVIQVADDPDATAVLRAARSFEFGFYQVNTAESGAERVEFLRATTTAMSAQGWSRLVAVVDGSTTVALFVPDDPGSGNEIEFGVTVRDGRDLIVAVVNANLAPLFELVRRHAGREQNHRLLER